MKISKKEYNKKLDDAYWNGVQAGMKQALENPDMVRIIIGIRDISNKAHTALSKLAESISKASEETDSE